MTLHGSTMTSNLQRARDLIVREAGEDFANEFIYDAVNDRLLRPSRGMTTHEAIVNIRAWGAHHDDGQHVAPLDWEEWLDRLRCTLDITPITV